MQATPRGGHPCLKTRKDVFHEFGLSEWNWEAVVIRFGDAVRFS